MVTLTQGLMQFIDDVVHDLLRTLAEGADVVEETLTQSHTILEVLVR